MHPNIILLSRFRADIARSLQHKAKDLLLAKDIDAKVQSLEPLELFYLVKEVGIDEGFPLMLYATPEQFQTCIDLDCWQTDMFSIEELDAWLAPFASKGPESLAQVFLHLDEELQTLYVSSALVVYETRDESVPEPGEDVERLSTVDNMFWVERRRADLELDPFLLIDALYRFDLEEAYRLLMSSRYESYSMLEEQAYGFRMGRLTDLGFPEPHIAASLFAKPKEVFVDTTTTKSHLPAIYSSALKEGSLFVQAAMLLMDAHVVERLEYELVHLINTAMVAYGESPRDMKNVGFVSERVRDTLSLGLEMLTKQSDPQTACAVLETLALFEIFKHGQQVLLDLHKQAKSSSLVFETWLNTSDVDDHDQTRADKNFVRALLSNRSLVHAGYDVLHASAQKSFETLEEVEIAKERLQKIVTSFHR